MRPSVVLDMKRIAVREVVGRFAPRTRASSARCCMAPIGMAATSICWSMRCPVPRCWTGRPEEEVGIAARH